jgi:hypothetical protein
LQRRPIAFFAPPDLELFFFYALQVWKVCSYRMIKRSFE